jgi:hypothetical protein
VINGWDTALYRVILKGRELGGREHEKPQINAEIKNLIAALSFTVSVRNRETGGR